MSAVKSQSIIIAETIASQMGGTGRLKAFIGARQFVAGDDALTFRFPKAKQSINRVKIKLEPSDTYTMTFYRQRTVKGVPTLTEVTTVDGVYCDMLVSVFEETTGLYLSL